jgi:hypothetical protein
MSSYSNRWIWQSCCSLRTLADSLYSSQSVKSITSAPSMALRAIASERESDQARDKELAADQRTHSLIESMTEPFIRSRSWPGPQACNRGVSQCARAKPGREQQPNSAPIHTRYSFACSSATILHTIAWTDHWSAQTAPAHAPSLSVIASCVHTRETSRARTAHHHVQFFCVDLMHWPCRGVETHQRRLCRLFGGFCGCSAGKSTHRVQHCRVCLQKVAGRSVYGKLREAFCCVTLNLIAHIQLLVLPNVQWIQKQALDQHLGDVRALN